MMKILKVILGIILVLVLTVSTVRLINAKKIAITKKDGVNDKFWIDIKGISHYVYARGENIDNPLVLFLHGGPGFPISYLSYYFSKMLEDEFTIVHYDQRHCGRTYYKNHEEKSPSMETMISDLDYIIDVLLEKYNKEKVILIGQSFGSVLGTKYVKEKPSKVEAYVGVSQVTDFDKGKIYAANLALEKIEDEKKRIRLKDSIEEFKKAKNINDVDVKNLEYMILSSIIKEKGDITLNPFLQMWKGLVSPDMSINDFRWFLNVSNTKKVIELENELIQYMYYTYSFEELGYDYDVAMYFISGDRDLITPYDMIKEQFEKINALDKAFLTIEGAGHTPFLDDIEQFSKLFKSLFE